VRVQRGVAPVQTLLGFVQICAEVVGRTPVVTTVGGGPTGEDAAVFNSVDCVFPFSNETTVMAIDAAREAGLLQPYLPITDMVSIAYEALLRSQRRCWTRTLAERRVVDRLGRQFRGSSR
jgi:hypothetical protein